MQSRRTEKPTSNNTEQRNQSLDQEISNTKKHLTSQYQKYLIHKGAMYSVDRLIADLALQSNREASSAIFVHFLGRPRLTNEIEAVESGALKVPDK